MVVVIAILAIVTVVLATALIALSRGSKRRQATAATEIDRLQEELAAAGSRADTAESELETAEARAQAAEARTAEIEAALEASIEQQRAEAAERADADEQLWALELARSERTWRHSVAVVPDAPNPFDATSDPLRLAIEIEAAALHEDTGADLSVQWDLAEPRGPSLLLLRTAQELLAVGARENIGLTLLVTADVDNEVAMSLIGEDDGRLNLGNWSDLGVVAR